MTRLSSAGEIVYHPMEDQLAGLLCSRDFHRRAYLMTAYCSREDSL